MFEKNRLSGRLLAFLRFDPELTNGKLETRFAARIKTNPPLTRRCQRLQFYECFTSVPPKNIFKIYDLLNPAAATVCT
jgi:hypothetical protein